MTRKALAGALACASLLVGLPAGASATHVTDHDGPPVSSLPAICKSTHGQDWLVQHHRAFHTYWGAMLRVGPTTWAGRVYHRLALEHLWYVNWYRGACRTVRLV